MARNAGMDAFPGVDVVIDRVLEMGKEDWTGRPVLLLDDVAVGGSTLVDRYVEICDLRGVTSGIECRVAVVDEELINEDVVENLRLQDEDGPVALRIPTKRVDQLATEIVTAFYRSGTPYFTDFPFSEEIELNADALDHFLTSSSWAVFDTTAELLAAEGQRGYSLLPSDETTAMFNVRACPGAAAPSRRTDGSRTRCPDDLRPLRHPRGRRGHRSCFPCQCRPQCRRVATVVLDRQGE